MTPMTVSEVMHRDVPTVDKDMPYKDVVRNLTAWHVPAVVVLDDTGQVSGVVSASDLIARPADSSHGRPGHFESLRHRAHARKARATTAAGLMTRPVVHVRPDTPLAEAAGVADEAGVRELPVLDTDGRVVGMVDRADLLADYLRTDEEIRDDILETVVLEGFLIDPARIDVAVRDGVVTLTGCLETRSLANFLAEAVSAVSGVVAVENRLSWWQEITGPERHFPGR